MTWYFIYGGGVDNGDILDFKEGDYHLNTVSQGPIKINEKEVQVFNRAALSAYLAERKRK